MRLDGQNTYLYFSIGHFDPPFVLILVYFLATGTALEQNGKITILATLGADTALRPWDQHRHSPAERTGSAALGYPSRWGP